MLNKAILLVGLFYVLRIIKFSKATHVLDFKNGGFHMGKRYNYDKAIFVMDRYMNDRITYTSYSYNLEGEVKYHWHNYYEITYIKSGHATHMLNNKIRELKHGDLIFMLPNDAHMFYEDTDVELKIFSFMPSFPNKDTTESILKTARSCVISLDEKTACRVEVYLERIKELYETQTSISEKYIKCMLDAICYEISESIQIGGLDVLGYINSNQRILEILDYIDTHYMEDLTLKTIAEKFGITANYFCEFFKKYVNSSFTKYLILIRIRHAIALIECDDKSIETIAQETGFKSTSYFSQAFKRICGMSPKSYQTEIVRNAQNRKNLK